MALPAGTIVAFVGDVAPEGWHMCDGAQLDSTQNRSLFLVIGRRYGGDNFDGFNLPNLKGRFLLGASEAHRIAQSGGDERVALEKAHMPPHDHSGSTTNANNQAIVDKDGHKLLRCQKHAPKETQPGELLMDQFCETFEGGNIAHGLHGEVSVQQHTHGVALEGGGKPFCILPPFVVINYIIKL